MGAICHLLDLKQLSSAFKHIKTKEDKFDLAASFQKTVLDIIYKKTKNAINQFKNYSKENKLIVAGGVAKNKEIRKMINKLCLEENFFLFFQI